MFSRLIICYSSLMKRLRHIFIASLFLFNISLIQAQTFNAVDIDESVYRLLDIAEMKGILTNLSQVRPYSRVEIKNYLKKINQNRNTLSKLEKTVLDSALHKYRILERDNTVLNILKEGKVHFNNDEDALFPINAGLYFDSETRADFNFPSIHSTNFFTFFIEGDISDFASYNVDFSLGVNNVDVDAFSPFAYTDIATDSYYIALSHGLNGSGLFDGDKDGTSFSMMSRPEISTSFWDNKLQLGFSRYRRDLGNGYGNLTLSSTARPYSGIDLKFRPLDWFNMYYSVGSLNNWFKGDDRVSGDHLDQKMLTTQLFEFMPLKWLYTSLSTSVVWGKRLELAYFNPLLPPVFGQSLTGDHDNVSADFSIAVKIPIGLKIYGAMYLDEMRSTDGWTTDPVMPFATQAGIKFVIPKLPFTITSFQYTKLEPYVYAHYEQDYYFADDTDLFDITWTHNGENLGYHLPPNSDEFLFRIESMPYKNFRFLLQYQYIRHGDGDPALGEMEGSIDSGSFDPSTGNTKDFLNDGIYEKIHIATFEASYEFEELPIFLSLDYSFNYGTNFENIVGNTMTRNILGMKIHIFP